ncbi:hypothetical protein KAZ01_02020 [Candidatus Gracilibacteria bacterium]|nr:hypothetical protein [Candidatus Gracilibacteria bacterium]
MYKTASRNRKRGNIKKRGAGLNANFDGYEKLITSEKINNLKNDIFEILKGTKDALKGNAYVLGTLRHIKESDSGVDFATQIKKRYENELNKDKINNLIIKYNEYSNISEEIHNKKISSIQINEKTTKKILKVLSIEKEYITLENNKKILIKDFMKENRSILKENLIVFVGKFFEIEDSGSNIVKYVQIKNQIETKTLKFIRKLK